jgi:general secretion pathway protein A
MYESFYGFRERPFDLTPNPRYLVLTDAHREALSNLEYAIASRKGVTLLLGDAGTGKTTVIRTALERQPEQVHCVQLHNPALRRNEFVEMLATRFGLSLRAMQSKTTLLLELEGLLAARRERGEFSVLVIDEAQSLPLELLEEVRLLANIETANEKLLSVILAGQPELADRLNERSLRQLKQRVALRCELRPLTLLESCAYIAGRIRAAGGVGAQTFTREAVILMHERAHGIPRTLSVIADNALLAGFAMERRPVSTQLVLEVCGDLDLPPGKNDKKADMPSGKSIQKAASAPAPVTVSPNVTVPPGPKDTTTERMSPNRLITFDSAAGTDSDEADKARPDLVDNRTGNWRRRFSFFRATV